MRDWDTENDQHEQKMSDEKIFITTVSEFIIFYFVRLRLTIQIYCRINMHPFVYDRGLQAAEAKTNLTCVFSINLF